MSSEISRGRNTSLDMLPLGNSGFVWHDVAFRGITVTALDVSLSEMLEKFRIRLEIAKIEENLTKYS